MRRANGPNHDAGMPIVSKLQGGGLILYHGIEAMRTSGTPPPRTVIGDPSQVVQTGPKPLGFLDSPSPASMCRTEDDALRYDAFANEAPEGDDQLALQGDDHLLARAAGVLGARLKPLGQGALLLL